MPDEESIRCRQRTDHSEQVLIRIIDGGIGVPRIQIDHDLLCGKQGAEEAAAFGTIRCGEGGNALDEVLRIRIYFLRLAGIQGDDHVTVTVQLQQKLRIFPIQTGQPVRLAEIFLHGRILPPCAGGNLAREQVNDPVRLLKQSNAIKLAINSVFVVAT